MTCSRIILQTRSVTGGNFSSKRQLETPLRCKLQEKIASCNSALSPTSYYMVVAWTMLAWTTWLSCVSNMVGPINVQHCFNNIVQQWWIIATRLFMAVGNRASLLFTCLFQHVNVRLTLSDIDDIIIWYWWYYYIIIWYWWYCYLNLKNLLY